MHTIPSPTSLKRGADTEAKTISGDPRLILLIELINLLGLFINHARHAKGARATAVIFDQIIQRLQTIEKIPGHDGAMILRRIANRSSSLPHKLDYHTLFADMAFSGSDACFGNGTAEKNAGHLSNALEQTFGYFAEQGISALYIQLPGNSLERIDQLRLAFNIIARFHHAVENNASITFRYFGRAMAIPLIRDRQGKPDPNLTVVAGLNGLSSINMRELLKQAEALGMLSGDNKPDKQPFSNFNQVFRVRSLRSQLIRPIVEVNNLPWMSINGGGEDRCASDDPKRAELSVENRTVDEESFQSDEKGEIGVNQKLHSGLTPHYLSMYADPSDPYVADAIEKVFSFDVVACGSRDIGEYIGAATKLMQAMEADRSEESPLNQLTDFLFNRFDQLPERLLDRLVPQRQGLKIEDEGRTLLVGMIHPKLLDQLSIIKERVLTQRKILAAKSFDVSFPLDSTPPEFEWFGIDKEDNQRVFKLINLCRNSIGELNHTTVNAQIDKLGPLKTPVFELLWSILRQTSNTDEISLLLDNLKLISMRLEDPRRAIGFLMTDLFQIQNTEIDRDRNAFVLINSMLYRGGNASNRYTDRTPNEVFSSRKGIAPSVLNYVTHRLGVCRSCAVAKFSSLRMQSLKCQNGSALSHASSRLTFQLMLALEREGFIFMALAGGETGRAIVREALEFYSDTQSGPYKRVSHSYLPDLIDHFGTILRVIAIVGSRKDIAALKFIEQSTAQWMALDSDAGHIRRVQEMLRRVPDAIRNIQVQAQ